MRLNARCLLTVVAFLTLLAPARADPYLADFKYPFPVARYEFTSQGHELWMSYMDIAAARPNGRRWCSCTARTSAAPPGRASSGAVGRRLPRHRAGPSRLLPLGQAARLPVQPAPARRQHACPAGASEGREADRPRPLDGRHARHALRADVSGRHRRAGARQPDRAGGLESQGRAAGDGRRAIRQGAARRRPRASRSTSRQSITTASGSPSTTAGSTCWRRCTPARTATSSPGTRR